jgi:O-Antigen ligase
MGFFLFLVYLAAFLLRPSDLSWRLGQIHLMDILAALAMGGAGLELLTGRRASLRGPQVALVVIFVLWATLTKIITQRWLWGAWAAFDYLGINLFLFLLAILNVDSLRRVRITARFLVIIAVVLAVQGAVAVHLGLFREHFVFSREVPVGEADEEEEEEEDQPRRDPDAAVYGDRGLRIKALGYLNDPNDLAQFLVAMLPLAFALRREGEAGLNLLRAWLPAAIIVYGVYLSRSRGAILTLGALVFIAVQRRMHRLFAFALGSLAGLTVFTVSVLGTGTELDMSASDRIYAWHAGFQMLKESPIWGVGFGNFGEGHELLAHNCFIHCAAELGLVGYFLWLSIIVVTFANSSLLARLLDPDDEFDADMVRWLGAVQQGLVAFLVAGFFLSRAYSFILFLLVGLSAALVGQARREDRPQPQLHPLAWISVIVVVGLAALGGVYLAVRVSS